MTEKEIERLAKVETKIDIVCSRLSKIENNHLPHIKKRIEGVHNRIDSVKTWLIGLMGGMIVSLALLIFNLIVR